MQPSLPFESASSRASSRGVIPGVVPDSVRDVLASGGLHALTARCNYSVDDAVAALTKKTPAK